MCLFVIVVWTKYHPFVFENNGIKLLNCTMYTACIAIAHGSSLLYMQACKLAFQRIPGNLYVLPLATTQGQYLSQRVQILQGHSHRRSFIRNPREGNLETEQPERSFSFGPSFLSLSALSSLWFEIRLLSSICALSLNLTTSVSTRLSNAGWGNGSADTAAFIPYNQDIHVLV